MLMDVFHTAKLANADTLAFHQQLLLANRVAFAGLQAFGGVFMRHRHGPVAGNVVFGSLIQLGGVSYRKRSCYRR
jgi:hypothetical protein